MLQANVTSQAFIFYKFIIINDLKESHKSQVTCNDFWFLNTSYNNNIIIINYYIIIIIDPSPITKAYACDM